MPLIFQKKDLNVSMNNFIDNAKHGKKAVLNLQSEDFNNFFANHAKSPTALAASMMFSSDDQALKEYSGFGASELSKLSTNFLDNVSKQPLVFFDKLFQGDTNFKGLEKFNPKAKNSIIATGASTAVSAILHIEPSTIQKIKLAKEEGNKLTVFTDKGKFSISINYDSSSNQMKATIKAKGVYKSLFQPNREFGSETQEQQINSNTIPVRIDQ